MKNHVLHDKVVVSDMRELIEWAAGTHKNAYAYSYRTSIGKEAVRISFTELADDVRALSSKLISMDIKDKKCVVIGKMSYEWALLYYSIIIAGGVIVLAIIVLTPLQYFDLHAENSP